MRVLPFCLCRLWKYWQVRTRVNRKMDNRPSEQISTAHRYTSAKQAHRTVRTVAWSKEGLFTAHVQQKWGRRQKQYLQINARARRWCHPEGLCGLEKELLRKSTKAKGIVGRKLWPDYRVFLEVAVSDGTNHQLVLTQFNKQLQRFPEISQNAVMKDDSAITSAKPTTHKHAHTPSCVAALGQSLGVSHYSLSWLSSAGSYTVVCVLVSVQKAWIRQVSVVFLQTASWL